jgi:hypothetical protein
MGINHERCDVTGEIDVMDPRPNPAQALHDFVMKQDGEVKPRKRRAH